MKKCLNFIMFILIAIPAGWSQEFLLHDETFTWTKYADQCGGFHYWYDYGQSPRMNWTSPANYKNGLFYFHFQILDQPTNKPFKLNFCIWTEFNGSSNWREDCATLSDVLAGPGSVSEFSSVMSPAYGGGIDWTDLSKLWRFGNPLWVNGHNMGNGPYCTDHPEEWADVDSYLPLRLRVTIVAVPAGSTFSGWANYLGTGIKPPTPSYTINYSTEKTNQSIPAMDEYSYSSSMSPVYSGSGAQLTLQPGQDVYFRTKTQGSNPASDIQHLVVPSRPATPTFILDLVNYRTSTVVTSDYEYSNYSDMSGAISGSGTYVPIPNGTTKYFRKKATSSSFRSGIQTLNASTPPTNNEFIAYWPLDNSGNDISGRNHNLTLFNGATYSTDKQRGSHSLSLDGVDDYASSDAINLGNEFTIVMWTKVNTASSIRTLIANAPSGDKVSGFKFMINTYGTSDRRIIFESGNGSGLHSTTTAANAFSFSVWNHVALVVNRTTGVATIYYNGINVTSISDVHTSFNTNAVLRLGMMTNNQCGMSGLLDDVRIYDKVLSQGEIQAIMSGNVPVPLNPPTSLIATLAGNSAQLRWTDNSTSEDGFRVERSFDSLTGYNEITSLPANVTVYTDNGITTPGTKYFYKVRAFNSAGNSTYSNIASVTTNDIPQPGNEFIAYWLLDNSGNDISGNNHNLTLFNGATYSTDKKRGTNSLSLDGVDDYASSDAINLGNDFTIMMWAKLTATTNIRTLIANAPSGDKVSGFKFMINTYGTSDRRIIFESGNGSSRLYSTTTAANVFSFNIWTHVALVVNRTTGVATIYYNGINVTSISDVHTAFNTNAVLRLGMMTNNQCGMSGLLDDVRIYDKVLSQGEIQAVMNNNLKGTEENFGSDTYLNLNLYPNPFLDELILNNTSGIQIQIIDILGKIKMEMIPPKDMPIHINTQSLKPGIYFIRIINEDGTIQISKAVKSNIL